MSRPESAGHILLQPTERGLDITITDRELRPVMTGLVPLAAGPFRVMACPLYRCPPAGAGGRRRRRRPSWAARVAHRSRITIAAVYCLVAGWSRW